jgi:hypothetical protein
MRSADLGAWRSHRDQRITSNIEAVRESTRIYRSLKFYFVFLVNTAFVQPSCFLLTPPPPTHTHTNHRKNYSENVFVLRLSRRFSQAIAKSVYSCLPAYVRAVLHSITRLPVGGSLSNFVLKFLLKSVDRIPVSLKSGKRNMTYRHLRDKYKKHS